MPGSRPPREFENPRKTTGISKPNRGREHVQGRGGGVGKGTVKATVSECRSISPGACIIGIKLEFGAAMVITGPRNGFRVILDFATFTRGARRHGAT